MHVEHHLQGSNPADKNNEEINHASIQQAITIANLAGAKKVILHPGAFANSSCSEENAIHFIKNIKDTRILIENMPYEKASLLLTTPQEMKSFLKKTGKGFIFHFAHYLTIAHTFKKDPFKLLKDFLALQPKHFHMSGQKLKSFEDRHL